ncbi:MAG: HaeIII family restriction endonuclease [Mogibacterium sp.]|nr:HaeIII family restriction endonuclease [Mogibacterium sp.]
MINDLFVAACVKGTEERLNAAGIPYEIEENDAYRAYMNAWESSDKKDDLMRQVRPALAKFAQNEPYLHETGGAPLRIRFNGPDRDLDKDSFAEVLLERSDLDWAIGVSIKNDAKVLTDMRITDRNVDVYLGRNENVVNEIEDFGDRIFGVPCSNEYFDEVNAILEKIHAHDRERWAELLMDDDFVYDTVITPMLSAFAREIPRICENHPEAPMHFFDYFYGKYDYYFLNPIEELEVTRMGAVNPRGGLGRVPGNDNHLINVVAKPTKLLDVRFATGSHGEISKDTIQLSFDGGWAMCFTILVANTAEHGRSFNLGVYMPVTPFGSYRDQAKWDPEA